MKNRPPIIQYFMPVTIGLAVFCILAAGCGEFKKTEPEMFYSETTAPTKQIFRWSNGKMPKSFDPAMASAPPETDIVRAIYEGLTDTDPKTLDAVPAVAKSWNSTDETRIWTFTLRKDAFWSNGEKVTAQDFVRSWKRLAKLGDKLPHHALLHNITGSHEIEKTGVPISSDKAQTAKSDPDVKPEVKEGDLISQQTADSGGIGKDSSTVRRRAIDIHFGVEAVSEFELRVTLNEPDEEFPKLVAHPMFRPVYASGNDFTEGKLDADIVTNGAFRVASVGTEGVTLDRDERFYDRDKIKLERVLFVPSDNADSALASYKQGKVDVVTNASFEPLALKILTPYVDFKRTTHSALNFYEFNLKRQPFNDRRVREALAIAIDRERLTEGEMEGSAQPASDFLPFDVGREKKLRSDPGRARSLLVKSGFPNAKGFPKIRLLVNRNNVQEKIARSVAKMWKDNLNVETEIVIRSSDEFDEIKESGDYDMIRRGVVLPTADETANMLAIFAADKPLKPEVEADEVEKPKSMGGTNTKSIDAGNISLTNSNQNPKTDPQELLIDTGVKREIILTEEEAIASIPAIPLYFPTSYSLVKPYVLGFEMNTLDAPSLKNVYIDSGWQPGRNSGKN